MKEYKTINIRVYRTKDGTPTCRKSPIEECLFLEGRQFGFDSICGYSVCGSSGFQVFRNEETGYLQPSKKCPLWSNENE